MKLQLIKFRVVVSRVDLSEFVGAGGGRDRFFGHRQAAAGVGGLPRTACESAGERRRGGAGSLPNLGGPATRMVARMLARAVGGTDFRPARHGGGGGRAVCLA